MSNNNQENEMLAQSPINFCATDVKQTKRETGGLEIELQAEVPMELQMVHHGENFQVNWNGNKESSSLTVDGKVFHPVQFHFHSPSEHTIEGKPEAMEFHLVHQAADGSLAVVGMFIKEGAENQFLKQFWSEIKSLEPNNREKIDLGTLDTTSLELLTGNIYRYAGSLTTPPYSEGVTWIVMEDMAEASADQIELYRSFIPKENAREVQQLNGRDVCLCMHN